MSFNQSNILHESIASFDKGETIPFIEEGEEEEKVLLTKRDKIKKYFYKFLMQLRNRFLFYPTLALINFIIEKNHMMIENHTIDVMEYLFYNFEGVLKLLEYLEKINFEGQKIFKEKIVSHELTLKDFDQTFNLLFSNFQLNIIPHSISFFDFSPKKRQKPLQIPSSIDVNSYDRLHLLIDEQICLFNVKENEIKTMNEVKNLELFDFLKLIFEVFITKFEIIIYFLMICYYFYNSGIVCWLLFFYMFSYLIFEEKKSKILAWKICFIYFFLVASLKLFFYLKLIIPYNQKAVDDPSEYIPFVQVLILYFEKYIFYR